MAIFLYFDGDADDLVDGECGSVWFEVHEGPGSIREARRTASGYRDGVTVMAAVHSKIGYVPGEDDWSDMRRDEIGDR